MDKTKFIEKVKENKLQIAGGVLGLAGAVISVFSKDIEEKLLDKRIDNRIDMKLAEIVSDTEGAQNE